MRRPVSIIFALVLVLGSAQAALSFPHAQAATPTPTVTPTSTTTPTPTITPTPCCYWEDLFNDESRISASSRVEVSGGDVELTKTIEYNFSSGAGSDKWAYEKGDNAAVPPGEGPGLTGETEMSSGEYTNIATSDDSRAHQTCTGFGGESVTHHFEFNIDESCTGMASFGANWEGYATDSPARLYIWRNSASAWLLSDTAASTGVEETLTSQHAGGACGQFISGGKMHLLALDEDWDFMGDADIYTDYVKATTIMTNYPPSGTVTSVDISPSCFGPWDTFTASHNLPANTDINYEVQTSDGSTLCSITAAEAATGYNISSCAGSTTPIKLFATLSSSDGTNTPMLHDWTVTHCNYYLDISIDPYPEPMIILPECTDNSGWYSPGAVVEVWEPLPPPCCWGGVWTGDTDTLTNIIDCDFECCYRHITMNHNYGINMGWEWVCPPTDTPTPTITPTPIFTPTSTPTSTTTPTPTPTSPPVDDNEEEDTDDVIVTGTIIQVAPGGGTVESYQGRAIYYPACMNIMDVRDGDAPFTGLTSNKDNDNGNTTFGKSGVSSVTPCKVARLVPRLLGDAGAACSLQIYFDEITGSGGSESWSAYTITYRRGDANGDGKVSIKDAMVSAQYIAGNRLLSEINAVNLASVKHDTGGDVVLGSDDMFIAQYIVGLRNAAFAWTG